MALILVVEDEHFLRSAIAQLLALHGHEVLQARSGSEAVETCMKRRVDLVITDLVIPGIDGLRLIPTLREGHPGLPIIAISARFSGTTVKTVKLLAGVGTLEKPFTQDQLFATVDKILGKDEQR
jgi:DNA-binding response OmpR family regulator